MMLIQNIKRNPIQIGVVLLILVMAVLNFVMIAELPLFVSSLQIEGKIHDPEPAPTYEDKAPENLDGSVKDRMDRIREVSDNPDHILYRNRRYDQGLER